VGETAICPGFFPSGFSAHAGIYVCRFDVLGLCYHRVGSWHQAAEEAIAEALAAYGDPHGNPSTFAPPPIALPPMVVRGLEASPDETCEKRQTRMTYRNQLEMPLVTFGADWEWCFDGVAVTYVDTVGRKPEWQLRRIDGSIHVGPPMPRGRS